MFLRMRNRLKIEFISEEPDLDYWPKPVPASKMVPEWYKKMNGYMDGIKNYENGFANSTIKKCMPVFDSMTTGYYILLPSDVNVSRNKENGGIVFSNPIDFKLVTEHANSQVDTMNIPKEFNRNFLKWTNNWIVKTPKGWSTLFVQPMHRDDLPFQILPAIVDTDGFKLSVQFPFILRNDFEGVIPANTPIAQVIPFKRNDWEAEYSTLEKGQKMLNLMKHSIFFENRYKRTFWNKKTYK